MPKTRSTPPLRASLAFGPHAGLIVGGRFELLSVFGDATRVWRVRDKEREDAQTVVKFVELGGDDGTVLLDAMRRLRPLQIESLAAVIDAGQVESEGWVAVSLVDGEPLDLVLRRDARIPPRAVVKIVFDVACALDAIHGLSLAHGDVKPSNIVIRGPFDESSIESSSVLASLLPSASRLTGMATRRSSPYASPEQVGNGDKQDQFGAIAPITSQADVWSLGAIAYRMLVGTPPFGIGGPEVLARISSADPLPASHEHTELPVAVDAVFTRVLAKKAEDRYPSAGAFAKDLAAAIQGFATEQDSKFAASPIQQELGEARLPAPGVAYSDAAVEGPSAAGRWVVLLLAGGFLLAVIVFAAVMMTAPKRSGIGMPQGSTSNGHDHSPPGTIPTASR